MVGTGRKATAAPSTSLQQQEKVRDEDIIDWLAETLSQPPTSYTHTLQATKTPSRKQQQQQSVEKEAPHAEGVEGEESEGDDIIRLDSVLPARVAAPPMAPKQRQLMQEASRIGNMRFETGLPTPSYFRFEKIGKTQKTSLDPNAKAMTAHIQAALQHKAGTAAPKPRQAPNKIAAGSSSKKSNTPRARATQGVYERDKEREQDAKMLLMRNYIDPKRFYKGLDSLAPDFQIGTVMEGRLDFVNGRLPRRERKRTFVDEILADRGVRSYTKKKFTSIQETNKSGRKGQYKARQVKHKPKWAR